MFPAARIFDPITHDGVAPCGSISGPLAGPCPLPPVVIESLLAAHVGCTVVCTGLTSLGPVHPPTIPIPPLPGASVTGGGGGGGAPADPSTDTGGDSDTEDSAADSEMKQFSIRVVGGGAIGGSIRVFAGTIQGVLVEITDVTEGETALYLIPSLHGGVSFGTPLSGELKLGGPPNSFVAPRGIRVTDFYGRVWIGEASANLDDASLPADNMSRVAMNFGAMIRGEEWWDIQREEFSIDDFQVGETEQLGTLAAAMIGAGEMIYVPFSHQVIDSKTPPPSPVAPPPPPSPPIIKGSATVMIHGTPAARWFPSLDCSACGVFLGDPKQTATRTVFIG